MRFLEREVRGYGHAVAGADGARAGDEVGAEGGEGRVWVVVVADAGEDFERAGEVEDVDAGEEEDGDLEDWGGGGGHGGG